MIARLKKRLAASVFEGEEDRTRVAGILNTIQNINQATVQGLASTRQAEKAAQDLNDLARKLAEIVEQYRL